MSIRYAVLFSLIGALLVALAIQNRANPWLLLLLYPALSFLVLGLAYAGIGPFVYGKRPNGTRSWLGQAWSLPFSLSSDLVWWITISTLRSPAIGQVSENLYIGRRLTARDAVAIREAGFQSCLDLTAESPETALLRILPDYFCLPMLDGTAPTPDQLSAAVEWLDKAIRRGPVYVHCALGHGRTGTIVAAYLLASGTDTDIDAALNRLRQSRSTLSINPAQRKALQQFVERICQKEQRE